VRNLKAYFLKILEATTRWDILGRHLEPYGARGGFLARFEAKALE
jgi:hypothetical protein